MTSPAPVPKHSVPNPPAVLTAAQRHELARQFERAKQLAAKTPPDFIGVHRVLSECCTLDPGNTLFVAALLENLQTAEGKTAAAWFWQVWAQRQRLTAAIQAQRWGEALAAGWWLIGERPQEADALVSLATICSVLEHLPTQVQLLKAARDRAPNLPLILRPLAKALSATGHFANSANIWNDLLTIEPHDSEAKQQLQILAPSKTNPQLSGELAAQVKILLDHRQWDEAEKLLGRESGAEGARLELRQLGEEIMVGRARERTEIARQLAAASPAAAQQGLVAELLEEQRRIELGVAYARHERFSAEPEHLFELATALTRAGNFSESLKYLGLLKTLPAWRLPANIAEGENWQQLRQFDRAMTAYCEALDGPDLDPQDEFTQRGWHRAAVLAEALGQPALALAWLERLVAANPTYKDAQARLDKLRVICNKGGFSAGP
jgi:tetratricopeptide (TPR) repeat protein